MYKHLPLLEESVMLLKNGVHVPRRVSTTGRLCSPGIIPYNNETPLSAGQERCQDQEESVPGLGEVCGQLKERILVFPGARTLAHLLPEECGVDGVLDNCLASV